MAFWRAGGPQMCGIVGYIGFREATDFLVGGLRRLEYRGYDSSGVATVGPSGRLTVTKTAGRIDDLESRLANAPLSGRIGIGHTRWATHGPPTDANAHPHLGGDGAVAVVHNGVIENFQPLKKRLESEGYAFQSSTDTEVIAHLIASCLRSGGGFSDRLLVRSRQFAIFNLQLSIHSSSSSITQPPLSSRYSGSVGRMSQPKPRPSQPGVGQHQKPCREPSQEVSTRHSIR